MPRYKGRRSTIELYKKEKERVTGIVKRLEAKGVIVPESIINKQAGDKILMKDVKRLQGMTRESIVKRSQVEVYSLDHLDVTVQTVTGKQAVRELKKQGVRSRRAKREEKTGVVSRYYIDIEEGFKIDLRNGKVIGRATKREIERQKQRRRDAEDWAEKVNSYEPELDDWEQTTYDDIEPIDFDDEFLNRYFANLEFNRKLTGAPEDDPIIQYLEKAKEQYSTSELSKALQRMADAGETILPMIFYSEEASNHYLSMLDRYLPLEDRYDFEMSRNDEEDSAEEEDE